MPIYCYVATRGQQLDSEALAKWTLFSSLRVEAREDQSSSSDEVRKINVLFFVRS